MTYFKNLRTAILLVPTFLGSTIFAHGMETNRDEKNGSSLITKQQHSDEDWATTEEGSVEKESKALREAVGKNPILLTGKDLQTPYQLKPLQEYVFLDDGGDNASTEEDEELSRQIKMLKDSSADDVTTEEDPEQTQRIQDKLDTLPEIVIHVEYLPTAEDQKVVSQTKLF